LLAGLHHAHELCDFDGAKLEVVHRDVSPHNVFITYDGQVKIVDFGIAKALRRSAAETRQGVLKGKIKYMSPEQVLNKRIDRRADVFAAGVLLWEAAVGQRLWQGVDELDVMQALVGKKIPSSPRSKNPDVPEEIDRICQRALAPLDERYATALDMQNDLQKYLSSDRPTERELGDYISSLFDDKRQLLRSIIEEKLAQIATMPSAGYMPTKVVDTYTGVSSMKIEPARPAKDSGDVTLEQTGKLDTLENTQITEKTALTDTRSNPSSSSRRSSRRSGRLFVAGGAISVLAAVGFGIASRSPVTPIPPTTTSAVARTAEPPPAASTTVAEPSTSRPDTHGSEASTDQSSAPRHATTPPPRVGPRQTVAAQPKGVVAPQPPKPPTSVPPTPTVAPKQEQKPDDDPNLGIRK
jgi:serine/threonine-protein kinase